MLLESMGVQLDKRGVEECDWHANLSALKRFREEHGDTLIPPPTDVLPFPEGIFEFELSPDDLSTLIDQLAPYRALWF